MALTLLATLLGGPLARRMINERLASHPQFAGEVGRVSLVPWLGRGVVEDVVVRDREAQPAQPPLVRIGRTDVDVSLASVIRGPLRVKLDVARADIHLTPVPRPDRGKLGEAKEAVVDKPVQWREELKRAFPVEISRFELRDSAIRFTDATKRPKIDVGLEQLRLVATGLTTRPERGARSRPARVELAAVTTGDGRLTIHAEADPWKSAADFECRMQLRALALPALNPWLLEYANADVAAGQLDFDCEIAAAEGHYEGYVKPFFRELDFRTASDRDKNAAELLAKKAVSAVASLLKNPEEQKVATKAPFRGDLQNGGVDVWETIVNLLRNAFVQGLKEGFDGQRPRR